MNRSLKRSTCLTALFLSVLFVSSHFLPASENTKAENNAAFAIQIEVVSRLHQFEVQGSYAYFSPHEEFLQFSKILNTLLEPFEGTYVFEVERFPAKFAPNIPEVSLYLNDWRMYRDGEIRAVLGVKVKRGGVTETIGNFTGRSHMHPSTIRTLRDKSFDDAMQEACEDMFESLKPLFRKWNEMREVTGD